MEKTLENLAFKYKNTLRSLDLIQNIDSIGDKCFLNYRNLQQVLLNSQCRYVGEQAFGNCVRLETVNLNKVKTIGRYAFWGCKSLKNLILPEGLKAINRFAFQGCESLERVIIPHSVYYVGNYAFWGCKNLKEIIVFDDFIGSDYLTKGNKAKVTKLRGRYNIDKIQAKRKITYEELKEKLKSRNQDYWMKLNKLISDKDNEDYIYTSACYDMSSYIVDRVNSLDSNKDKIRNAMLLKKELTDIKERNKKYRNIQYRGYNGVLSLTLRDIDKFIKENN